MGTFDIRQTLIERPKPSATIKVWFDEKPFFRLARLWEKHAEASKEEVASIEEEISQAEKEADSVAYRVELRAISNRHREDLQSKAFAAFPIMRDQYGFEDSAQANKRLRDLQERIMAAYITKITRPGGDEQIINEDDNGISTARAILDEAPEPTIQTINKAIDAVHGRHEMNKYAEADLDFLSGN